MRGFIGVLCAVLVAVAAQAADVNAGYGSGVTFSSSNSGSNYGATTYNSTTIGTTGGTLERNAAFVTPDEGPNLKVQVGRYFLSRWYDMVDMVDFSFGAGPGFLINAHATKFAQVGFGYSDAYHVGFRGRSAGIWREKRLEAGVSLLYYQKVKRERITGWVESFRADKMDLDTATVYANNNDRAFTGVGAMVHALIMVNVNVRPAQAADFFFGWFGIDVLDDDTCKPHRNKDL
ncbi:MAG TPA: hypothetical protein VKX17_03225 [Planctomycetota bacterium]|nr:hypothetical protein [Planctomycetota bacterium]